MSLLDTDLLNATEYVEENDRTFITAVRLEDRVQSREWTFQNRYGSPFAKLFFPMTTQSGVRISTFPQHVDKGVGQRHWGAAEPHKGRADGWDVVATEIETDEKISRKQWFDPGDVLSAPAPDLPDAGQPEKNIRRSPERNTGSVAKMGTEVPFVGFGIGRGVSIPGS